MDALLDERVVDALLDARVFVVDAELDARVALAELPALDERVVDALLDARVAVAVVLLERCALPVAALLERCAPSERVAAVVRLP